MPYVTGALNVCVCVEFVRDYKFKIEQTQQHRPFLKRFTLNKFVIRLQNIA